jgi:N-dimethylarginine dimethylaminohydrolase
MTSFGGHTMVGQLRCVLVKRPAEAFTSVDQIAAQWQGLGYLGMPDLERANAEHACFVAHLEEAGAEVVYLPADLRTGLDSLYCHDPALITDAGAIAFHTGKPARRGEGPAMADALSALDIPLLGQVEAPGTTEGGDMLWLDPHTLAVGRTYRTNGEGIAQLRRLLAPLGVEVIEVPLVHWTGPGDVLHLMSLISLLDDDLAVTYSRLLPIPFRETLLERGVQLVDIPDKEFATQGCNVLALAPRLCLMLGGNPVTRRRLEAAGCQVWTYEGAEISTKGSGGPTCLTRPLWRESTTGGGRGGP